MIRQPSAPSDDPPPVAPPLALAPSPTAPNDTDAAPPLADAAAPAGLSSLLFETEGAC